MVSLSRKLAKSFAFGFALGFCLFILGSIGISIVPALPAETPLAGFGIGFACSITGTLSDDEKEAAQAEQASTQATT